MLYRLTAIFSVALTLFSAPAFVSAQTQSLCSGSVSINDTSQAQPGVLVVLSNSAQATFTVTGPAPYHGGGYYWVQQGIPAGTYNITWGSVSGCETPFSETKTTDAKGSMAFAGNYKDVRTPQIAPLPAPAPPSPASAGHFMTIKSSPPSASVYINESLVGTAPAKLRLPENVSIQIKCSLPGYSDYHYTYPAVGPLPAGVMSVNSEWMCALAKKMPVVVPQSLPAGQNQLPNQEQISTPPATPSNSPKPQGFFSRVWSSLTSFFRNIFGGKNSIEPISNTP